MTIPKTHTRVDAPSRGSDAFETAMAAALANIDTLADEMNATATGMDAFATELGSLSNVILNGSGAPAAGLGQDGNYYINTDTGDLYYKAGGAWSLKGSLKGPAALSYSADTGAAGAYVMTPAPALAALDPARLYLFRAANANTGASTLNVSALGAKAIVDKAGAALAAGSIVAGQLVLVGYVVALDSFMLVGGGGSGSGNTAAWTSVDAAVTRTADATFTVTDTATNQAVFVPGRPIRFRQNSGTAWLYAMVTTYAAGTVTLAGAPYTATIGADSGRQMQYGEMTRLQQETFQIAGRFSAVATTQALKDYLLLNYAWLRGKAYCVGFRVLPLVDDSGAAQPRVNIKCNGNLVSTSNSGAGLAVSDAAWTTTTTDIDPAGYGLGYGQALELTIDANGTNDDARDLTVIVSLVLE